MIMFQVRTLILSITLIVSANCLLADNSAAREPLAGGLPSPLDRDARKPWTSSFILENDVLMKDGAPFFPIGFVFGQSDEAMAQARAMGANSIHMEIGWHVAPGPGEVPADAFAKGLDVIQRASDWGLASFPLLTGHYIPNWFSQEYPVKDYWPVGSDGKRTGSWTPYSLHFTAMREHISDFWKSAAKLLTEEPSVIGAAMWNEPAYGGTWNKGDQFAEYSSWAVEVWRNDLKKRYLSLDELNENYGTTFESWDKVQPPHSPEEYNRRCWLEWLEFGQHSFANFFEWERTIIKESAPDLKLTNKKQTNLWDSSAASSGTNWHLMGESEDFFGINMYSSSATGSRNRLDASVSYADGKPVFIFEINSMPPGKNRTPDAVRVLHWAPIAGGARGMFIFALIKGTEHGILGDEGADDEIRAAYAKFIENVGSHQRELASPRVKPQIGVLYSTTTALQIPGGYAAKFASQTFNLFRNSHYDVDFIPQERCNQDYLQRYDLIVLPTGAILKPDETKALERYVDAGGGLIAFGGSLAKDMYFEDQPIPEFLGLGERGVPIGNRRHQTLSKVASGLELYYDPYTSIDGVEMVSAVEGDAGAILPGGEVRTHTDGTVLAWNSDSYPAILKSNNAQVVYLAFDSNYSEELRMLVEGITRQEFGILPEAQLVNATSGLAATSVVTGLRQDYQDTSLRYMIAVNSSYRPQIVEPKLSAGWILLSEQLHGTDVSQNNVVLEPREAYLFTLKKD